MIVEDNVVALPGAAGERAAVGADRLLQPGRDEGPATCRRPSPATRATTARTGTSSGPSTRAPTRTMHAGFDEFCRERGAPPLPELEFIHESPHLNLYLYPGEVDYPRARPLGDDWHNLEASVRATDAPW